ncbi:MAG: adenine phosphoribosyltransferase [Candidatus Daviesbacteria bacterium]
MNYKQYIRPGKSASDITPLLLEGSVFHSLIDDLVKLFEGQQIDKVACVEGRGFILGSAVAYKLGVGLVPVRQKGKLQNEIISTTFVDYSEKEKELELHLDAITKGDKILIIDDWVETGNTLRAVIKLIEQSQGEVVGVGTLMDDSKDDLKNYLKKYNYKYLEQALPTDVL